MKRAAIIALVALYVALGSCNFAVKHPAATAGIVAGSVALFTCELAIDYEDTDDQKTCLIASAAVGLGLTALAAAALWLGSEDEPETTTAEPPPKVDWDKIP